MARFAVTGWGWPCQGGALLIPPSTVLDTKAWSYNGFPLPMPPSPDLICLHQHAYDLMLEHHEYYKIQTAGDIFRHGDPPTSSNVFWKTKETRPL